MIRITDYKSMIKQKFIDFIKTQNIAMVDIRGQYNIYYYPPPPPRPRVPLHARNIIPIKWKTYFLFHKSQIFNMLFTLTFKPQDFIDLFAFFNLNVFFELMTFSTLVTFLTLMTFSTIFNFSTLITFSNIIVLWPSRS